MAESKGGKLSKNIVLFAINSFGSKLLAFFLVPLYTSYLTTEEYGTIDVITTTASLLLCVFTLCIYEAVMRFTIEDKNSRIYFKIGVEITLSGILIAVALSAIARNIIRQFIPFQYIAWIVVLYVCNAAYNLFSNYLRAIDKVHSIVTASLINSAIMMALNIYLIVYKGMGMNGYLIATFIGPSVSAVLMAISASKPLAAGGEDLHKKTVSQIRKEMLGYSIPSIFVSIAWWVNSSLDKYFVVALCGAAANGIYSVAYKIPTILSVFQNIFTQAWSISAVTDFDKDDTDGFFGRTNNVYTSMMILACMAIMFFNKPISKLLYAKEFYFAWKYVPYLLVATLFGAMAGYLGGIFSAVKKPVVTAYTTFASAIVNAALNFILIPIWGVSGAAIATLCAYFVSWIARLFASRRYIRMKSGNVRIFVACGILVAQMFCAISDSSRYFLQVILIAVNIFVLRETILEVSCKIWNAAKVRFFRK